jgi:membrane fusion protein, multidrug efflux system
MSSVKALPLALLLLAACGEKKAADKAPPALPPVKASLAAAALSGVPEYVESPGTVRARVTSPLSARLMAYVRDVRVQAGDPVRAGQVLIVLDARDVENAVRQAESARAEARGALPEVQNAIAAAKAGLDLADSTFNRMKDLYEKKSITSQEFDEASARRRMAQANYDMVVAKRTQVEAKIKQSEDGLAQANLQKSFTELTAPFAGIVTERKAEPGVLATPGVPLLIVEQAGAYRAEIPVEESQVARIKAGSPVTVDLQPLGKILDLRVSEIVPAIDAASRTFIARVDLPGGLPLKSGLYIRARFPVGERQALLVPAAAVLAQGQLQRVFVDDGGRVRTRFVTLGARFGDKLEVLSGLTAGEKVVHPVPADIADGAPLEVRP